MSQPTAELHDLVNLTPLPHRRCLEIVLGRSGAESYSMVASFAPRTCLLPWMLEANRLEIIHKRIRENITALGSAHWIQDDSITRFTSSVSGAELAAAIHLKLCKDTIYVLFMLKNFNTRWAFESWEIKEAEVDVEMLPMDTPLYAAVQAGDTETIKLLICFRAQVDGYQTVQYPCALVTPLFEAIRVADANAAAVLLHARADPNKVGYEWDLSLHEIDSADLPDQTPHVLTMTCLWYATNEICDKTSEAQRMFPLVSLLIRFRADPAQRGKFEYWLPESPDSDVSDNEDNISFQVGFDNGTTPLDIARQVRFGRTLEHSHALLRLLCMVK